MITCSFCGKSEQEVFCIVAGPNVRICDQCVIECGKVIKAKMDSMTDPEAP